MKDKFIARADEVLRHQHTHVRGRRNIIGLTINQTIVIFGQAALLHSANARSTGLTNRQTDLALAIDVGG